MKHTLRTMKIFGAAAFIAIAPAALVAQSLPAGVGGYWKITKMYPKKPSATPGACVASPAFFSKMAKGSRVLVSDRNVVWGGASATDPAAHVNMVESADFAARYAQSGATLDELVLRSAKIEVIELAAPGNLPFDTIVVKDPSTVYFERCGLFMEAVHSSGFVAPPLPNDPR
jgi:hypothetical protein